MPKIILLGDSNVIYGFDSAEIERELDMPVVNMGLHAGLGQTFCMDLAKSGIRKGDLVVVCPGWYTFDTRLDDGVLGWLVLENHWNLWKEVPARYYEDLIPAFPTYLKKSLKLWVSNVGNRKTDDVAVWRSDFNEYGDIASVGNQNIMPGGYLETDIFLRWG